MELSTVNGLWDDVLEKIRKRINQGSFDTWFMETKFSSYSDGELVVDVPDQVYSTWLSEHYISTIHDVLSELGHNKVNVSFKVRQKSNISSLETAYPESNCDGAALNPRYTFSNYVKGNSNQFAHAAALAAAEKPAFAYNPLFIYGESGLGKTHLMHAIGHYILARNPKSKIVYLSSEEFTNELIKSIRFDETAQFRSRYRSVDILLIDDIQFIVGKERTQEEFFHTFNALYEAHKQLVISSDAPPEKIPAIEERLRSRFSWGLTADIQPPDIETKIAILRKKVEKHGIMLPDDTAFFIANNASNIRDLEGSMNRVLAFSSFSGKDISMELVSEALKVRINQEKKRVSIENIQKIVSSYYGIKTNDMKSKKRSREIVFPRQIAMYISRELTSTSLPGIGKEFGNRDHTTVLHAWEKISSQIKKDSEFEKIINALSSEASS